MAAETNTHHIVTGQHISEGKRLRARQFRQEPTAAEILLWRHLRGEQQDGLHFRRQQNIDGFVTDFYCHAAGLVVEVDGAVHQAQAEHDTERDRILGERGLRVVRVSNEDVEQRMPVVLLRLRTVARNRLEEKEKKAPLPP